MKSKITTAVLLLLLCAHLWSAADVSRSKTGHLFFIQSNKMKNIVQYDVQLAENGDLREPNPIVVYWVLENGKQEELNLIEKKFAYGIKSQKILGKNELRIFLVALKTKEIIVKKIGSAYKPFISIGGKYSILKKVYVSSEKGLVGLPKVNYLDLFGWNSNKKISVTERIIPGNGGH